ncbi:SDR family NAD(P)-dependent oxidoreductase [Cytobacillus oceanisediminis]|uniref:SDR family NAD(P)-dependent oxidoreductase n=1 Tax=Cytobacillus oceanisediminis TaxID=665099 RepID=UPI003735993C
MDVKDLNVVITGGSSGIGLAICKAFLSKGANVFNWDINESTDLSSFPSNYGFSKVDVIDEKSIKQAVMDAPERIDVLVNNAGIIIKSPLESIEREEWDRIYDINVRGTMLTAKYLAGKLKKSGRGRIINISSMTSKMGLETYSLYSSTKAAVSNLTKVWAAELAANGITVNAICPGWADTPMKEKLIQGIANMHSLQADEAEEAILSFVPQRRFIQTDEIAFTCLFLASELAKGISGQELYLDTGLTSTFKTGFHLRC